MTSLSKNVKFSVEKNQETGSFVVRSKTESFNLDHVVDKDIVSFYHELSKHAVIDTGILPVLGSGVLAIRSAGNHTQITFQHAPQINYINWGSHEGDKNAQTYLVAQPYRIWIGDTINGNLYGARMFYSPYPITNANQPLYHLNLPNTNCKGYRGNGVGWQCLYHREDWSDLPLNEKIIRFAERCSGVETFNDQNMSETDGPRFYQQKDKPDYTWDPSCWEKKTTEEGLDWVLDENVWIPILVRDLDDQDRHYDKGMPLTLGMALVGDYAAYYHDEYRPKPINALTRADLQGKITSDTVASWLVRSHNSATIAYVPLNVFDQSDKHRENAAQNTAFIHHQEEEEEQEEENIIQFICPINGMPCSTHEDSALVDALDNVYCQGCYEENTVYCENTDSTLPINSDYVYHHGGEYYDIRGINYSVCPNCDTFQFVPSDHDLSDKIFYYSKHDEIICCVSCIKDYLSQEKEYSNTCSHCSVPIPVTTDGVIHPDFKDVYPIIVNVCLTTDASGQDSIVKEHNMYCPKCLKASVRCPTGHLAWVPLAILPVPIIKKMSDTVEAKITHICSSCANPDIWQFGSDTDKIVKLSTMFSVVTRAEERLEHAYQDSLFLEPKSVSPDHAKFIYTPVESEIF